MPGTLRIARRWCITMVQVCLRVLERPAAWPLFSPGSRAGPRCIDKNTLGVKVSSSINSSILWTHESSDSSDLYPDSGDVQISSWNPFILRCKTSILPHWSQCLPFQVCQLNARPHIRQKPGWTVALAGWWSAWKMRTDIYSILQ